MIHIKDLRSSVELFKALSSEVRVEILMLLQRHERLNLDDIAKKLNLTNGAITQHVRKLEDSGLIVTETTGARHGLQKFCYLNEKKIVVEIDSEEQADNLYEIEIKVGHYVAFDVQPTCGLATKDSIIGDFDDPRYFADPEHVNAEIVWLTRGYLEYWIPNYLKADRRIEEIQIIAELASEAPSYNDNYPSDIYFYINGVEVGYWTSPGDFGDERGKQNPDWWPPHLNQYGMLKLIRINPSGTFIDGCRISDVTIDDLQPFDKHMIPLRLAVPDKAVRQGGLTIYGKHFGHYQQDIMVRILYKSSFGH
ncbi:ArsR/SmtB family transcription factor [Alicyclobacillus acidiphilus]|uniref:ArsR/SmtB family transcription factor n=1 Tax=Alicyclobacillus acidiphilus TaxID=182455 RepID=UPI00083535DF|nr:winged helix-turn-helix transcriptional regulator [Alicyclobacillus acidiphilus]